MADVFSTAPTTQPLTIEQLYQNVLGRAPDPGGLINWQTAFGSEIDPTEIQQFVSAAQAERPGAAFTPLDKMPNVAAQPSDIYNYRPAVTTDNLPTTTTSLSPSSDPYAAAISNTLGIAPSKYGYSNQPGTIGYDPNSAATSLSSVNQPLTVEQLYKDILGRSSDPGGAQYWAQMFGETIDPSEIAEFRAAAAPELVQTAYQNVLGRAADVPGAQYWTQQLQSGALTADKLKEALAYGAQGLEDRLKAQAALGKDIFAPEEYLKGTSGMGYQDIVNYVNTNVQDPVKIAQAAAQYDVSPNEILQAYQAQGQSPYTIEQIQDYLTQGQAGFGSRFQDILGATFGPASEQQKLDELLRAKTNNPNISLSDVYSSGNYSSKSIENIEKELRESSLNKYQEASRLSGIAQNIYGMPAEDAQKLGIGLIQDKEVDPKIKEIFTKLLKTGLTPELQTELLQDAASRAPNSPFFQANPQLLQTYTPLDIKESPKAPGQYGYSNNAPILSAKEADKLLNGEVIKGGNNYFGYGGEGAKDDALGWDLRSKYAGYIANGAGIFGVNATTKDITDFDKIEKEIQKLGGVKTETDAEGNVRQVVYKDVVDPESGQKVRQAVDVRNLFPYDEYTGVDAYKTYEQTKDALAKGAQQLGLNPDNFDSVKSLFDAVNDKVGNLYVVTGRANKWDPAVAQAQGITGVGRDRGGINHAQVLYQKVGDKLMPVQTLKTFNFDDPNTSRGVLGDIATGVASILSVPPIAIALAAATGGISELAAPLTTQVTAALVEAGLPQLLASSATNALTSGVLSELTGGDWKKGAGSTLVSNLIGGASGFTQDPNTGAYKQTFTPGYGEGLLNLVGYSGSDIANLISPEKLAKLGGIYAGSQISGLDPRKVLVNQLISQGIRSLPGKSTAPYGFDSENELKGSPEFELNPYEKHDLEQEYKKLMSEGIVEYPGITGLSLAKEDWMIDALKEVVPVLMSKGLNKADATLLASNLIGAASKG